MNILTEAIRRHHLSLARTLNAHARGAGGGEAHNEREAFIAFLRNELLPHARAEELNLYPLLDTLVAEHGRATATMLVDHEFIGDYASRIEQTARDLAATPSGDQREILLGRLRDLALRLDAIFELHLAKEERVYLPLVEEHVDETRQGNMLDVIHGSFEKEKTGSEDRPLDVRGVVPRERHKLIFDTFEGLRPGAAFILVNDHDPRPLFYQFQAEHIGQFSWNYLEQGPEVWRVRIGRST